MSVLARRLGKQGGVPPYKSWSYLMHNEQANETGGRVFYTDATGAGYNTMHRKQVVIHQDLCRQCMSVNTNGCSPLLTDLLLTAAHPLTGGLCEPSCMGAGETIPASDSEDENAHQENQLEGAGRERSAWVMQRLVREVGIGREAVAALAKRFHASEGSPT